MVQSQASHLAEGVHPTPANPISNPTPTYGSMTMISPRSLVGCILISTQVQMITDRLGLLALILHYHTIILRLYLL